MMEAAQFTNVMPGRLVKSPDGFPAFVPAALPPQVLWDKETIACLSEADQALGRLAGVGQTLPNPQLVIGPFVRREAVLSSRIEGTQASLSDLVLFEAAPTLATPGTDVLEVANYVRALEFALARTKEVPVSLRLVRETHAVLMNGVRGENRSPGEFRRVQNWIGSPGSSPVQARFVPPPPKEMTECLHALEKYLHAPSDVPALVRLAVVHYQFEAIHPFLDGNGRMGRLLITLLLCVECRLSQPLLYLSAYFERRRQEYYDALLRVSQAGRWGEWIRFFLRGVTDQAADAVDRSTRLLALREEFHRRCHIRRASALLLQLVDNLFAYPATTVSRTSKVLDVTPRSAQANIDKLIRVGILREVTGQKYARVYVADEIVRVVEPGQAPTPAITTVEPERVNT